jgi:hypothetical protein
VRFDEETAASVVTQQDVVLPPIVVPVAKGVPVPELARAEAVT